jgi:hypothetical protein
MAHSVAAMDASDRQFVVHETPVWRDRADFIIAAQLRDADQPKRWEQLWARRLDDAEFEVCCIPFFLYDLALGDVVATEPADEREYVMSRVVRSSGRFVFRVWFGESFHPRELVADELTALGALSERSSLNLLAVDAADDSQAQAVAEYLDARERRSELLYETGRTA